MTPSEHHALTNLLTGLKLVREAASKHLDNLARTLAIGDELIARGEAQLAQATVEDAS